MNCSDFEVKNENRENFASDVSVRREEPVDFVSHPHLDTGILKGFFIIAR